jgi:hydroxypyruvate isomerase
MPESLLLSANLSLLFCEHSFLDRFEAASRAGFAAVECQFPYDVPAAEIKTRLDAHGLRMIAINTSPGDAAANEFGLAAVPGRAADFKAQLAKALDYAAILRAPFLHCLSGHVATNERDAARATLLDNLAVGSAMAREIGVTLLIEPLNAYDRPGYFLSRSDDAAAIFAELGCDNAKLLFDIYHVQIMEGDLIRRLERHWPHVGHIQIASVPWRREPDEGEIAYPAVLAAIARLGYKGWIGCEYHPRGATEAGLVWRKVFGLA